ncbi:ABC transporter ATP-binding protein [Spirosoma sp. SC4-14]|uniref:ABC transporter ATP-binding protein n=1 Tax=Spirosoma sp. SC4-14 TaxID=3128900 RepID=UPI0030CCD482
MAIIETRGLTKQYGQFTAVDDVSIRVEAGEIYGFLGLNGAGKTTTIRMLLGMIRPTSGEIQIAGERIRRGQPGPWNKIGYLVEVPFAYPELTVQENIEICRRLRGLTDRVATNRIIEQLQLGAYQHVRAQNLSLGNAQRLGLAKALIHQPELLIVDEPTNGLDPAGIVDIRELLREMVRQRGTTVFISSHILGEVARLATRIGIIDKGVLLQELTVRQLEQLRKKRLCLQFREPADSAHFLNRQGYQAQFTEGNMLAIEDERAVQWPESVVQSLVGAGHIPIRLGVEEEDLESYFLRIIHQHNPKQ